MFTLYVTMSPFAESSHWTEIAKWAIQTISGLFLLSSFLFTYRHNVEVRSSDLLLKLEEHFNKLGPKLSFLEYLHTCYDPIKGILTRFSKDPNILSEAERSTLVDIDECLRFLYICALHSGRRIKPAGKARFLLQFLRPAHLPNAYYYFLNVLNDDRNRPELYAYLRRFYPIFSAWLDLNADVLAAPETRVLPVRLKKTVPLDPPIAEAKSNQNL